MEKLNENINLKSLRFVGLRCVIVSLCTVQKTRNTCFAYCQYCVIHVWLLLETAIRVLITIMCGVPIADTSNNVLI